MLPIQTVLPVPENLLLLPVHLFLFSVQRATRDIILLAIFHAKMHPHFFQMKDN